MAATVAAAMRGVPLALQTAATTGNGVVAAIPINFTAHMIQVIGTTGIGAGVVTIEAANDPDYTGTWSPIGTTIAATSTAEIDQHFVGVYKFIRARISTTVTGGSVIVNYVGGPE